MAANPIEGTAATTTTGLRWQPGKGIDSKRPNQPALLRLSPPASPIQETAATAATATAGAGAGAGTGAASSSAGGTMRSFPPPRYLVQRGSQPLLRVQTATDDGSSCAHEASEPGMVPGVTFRSLEGKRMRAADGSGGGDWAFMPKTPFPVLYNSDLESGEEGGREEEEEEDEDYGGYGEYYGGYAGSSAAQSSTVRHHHHHRYYPWGAHAFKSLPPFGSSGRSGDATATVTAAGAPHPSPPPPQSRAGDRDRRALSQAVHGVMLALQSLVSLAVFCALVCVTVWRAGDVDEAFWQWLWAYIQPAVALLTLLPMCALVYHEHRPLSDAAVVRLHLASLVLLAAPLAAAMVVGGLGQRSRCLGGWLVGCGALLFGFAVLAFGRAAVVVFLGGRGRGAGGDGGGRGGRDDGGVVEGRGGGYGTMSSRGGW